MNRKWLVVLILLLFVGAVGAGSLLFDFPYNPVTPPVANSNGSTLQGMETVANANNKFAFDLYSEITTKDKENVFFSPYSISSAFAMVYEGARETTKQEIQDVFYFPEYDILRPNFAGIYTELNKKNKDYVLRTGNALWVDQAFPLLDSYKQTVKKYYGGKSANLDIRNETEKSRLTINDFIKQQTNNKIKELIKRDIFRRDTVLVLTNAIYFEGKWKVAFRKSNTDKENFYVTKDNPKKVDMMELTSKEIENSEHHFNYADLNNLQIIELPYKGDLSMIVILPKKDLNDLGDVNYDVYSSWKEQMYSSKKTVKLIKLPKFKFDTDYLLNKNLSNLGMPSAFNGADFRGITDKGGIFVSAVIHKAFVDVDEKGTTAAAATAVLMSKSMMPIYNQQFIANHPFIFVIEENKTNNILFLGRVVDPS